MFALLIFVGCTRVAVADSQDEDLREQALSMFKSLHQDVSKVGASSTAAMITLGRTLFFDVRISASGKVACGQCHRPEFYGASDPATVLDAGSHSHNALTILNASVNLATGWYGDQVSVESQAIAALVSQTGLRHADKVGAMAKIRAIPVYQKLFSVAFPNNPDPITVENWATAIGAFERTLITPSPFDAYLVGNNKAISADAKKGLRRFIEVGCVACHNGVGIGGGGYQKFGVWEDYWPVTKSSRVDKGRFNVTRDADDLYVFRVANLRNVKMTAPYFHDGSVKTLPEAVRIMGKIQLRKTLSDDDVKYIVSFLGALTGKLPNSFSRPPDNSIE